MITNLQEILVSTEEVPTSLLSFKTIAPITARLEAFAGIVHVVLEIQLTNIR